MIQLRPRTLAAVALVATTLLAGCSNETPAALPAPTGTASATPSETAPAPSATPSSTITRDLPVPELDELSQQFSQEGASAFASYYTKVLNYSRNSGDVELLRSISGPECYICQYDIERIKGFLEEGYAHVGLETQFQSTWYLSWEPEIGEVKMEVTVDRPQHAVTDRQGVEIEQVAGLTDETFYLWLKWVDERWVVWEAE